MYGADVYSAGAPCMYKVYSHKTEKVMKKTMAHINIKLVRTIFQIYNICYKKILTQCTSQTLDFQTSTSHNRATAHV